MCGEQESETGRKEINTGQLRSRFLHGLLELTPTGDLQKSVEYTSELSQQKVRGLRCLSTKAAPRSRYSSELTTFPVLGPSILLQSLETLMHRVACISKGTLSGYRHAPE